MTAAAAVAHLLKQYPALPSEVAPVYFLLCAHDDLTVPGIARRLDMAQSTATRMLALLFEAGLLEQVEKGAKSARWSLTPHGRVFATTIEQCY